MVPKLDDRFRRSRITLDPRFDGPRVRIEHQLKGVPDTWRISASGRRSRGSQGRRPQNARSSELNSVFLARRIHAAPPATQLPTMRRTGRTVKKNKPSQYAQMGYRPVLASPTASA